MVPIPATVMALLPHARDLMSQCDPDLETVLKLLDHIPTEDLDVPTRVAVRHARQVAETGEMSDRHRSVARYALARLIVLLERHVAVMLS